MSEANVSHEGVQTANLAVDPIAADAAADPVEININVSAVSEAQAREQARKFGEGVKVEYIPDYDLEQAIADDKFNIRMTDKMTVGAGVKVERDPRNIEGMMDAIRAANAIITPVAVSRREDGNDILCGGYRRVTAARRIRKEEPDSVLAKRLAKIPAMIYTGLTPEQERELVNDQKSMGYSVLELFKWFCQQLNGGRNWFEVFISSYQQLGNAIGNAQKVQDLDSMPVSTESERKAKEKALREWGTGYFFVWWQSAWKHSPLLIQLTEETYAFNLKLIRQRPSVMLNSQRMRAINKEIKKDRDNGNWNTQKGTGPLFEGVMSKLASEDNNLYNDDGTRKKREQTGPKFRKMSEITEFLGKEGGTAEAPSLLRKIIGITFVGGGDATAVQTVKNLDNLSQVYDRHKENVKPEVKRMYDLVFNGTDSSPDEFEKLLLDNYPGKDETFSLNDGDGKEVQGGKKPEHASRRKGR